MDVTDIPLCPGGDCLGELVEQIRDDGDVVRGEIPYHVAVVLIPTQTQPGSVDVQNATQFAGVDQLFQLPHGGVGWK